MRRPLAFCLAALVAGLALPVVGAPQAVAEETVYRPIRFPVEGAVTYWNDWGQPRSGGRTHKGTDLMGAKGQRVLSTVDGTVNWVRVDDGSGLSGNMLSIRDADGWQYWYIHLNNDTPGTDDGLNPPEWRFAPGIQAGSRVTAGQHVAFLGDSGNAEGTAPHVHFEIHRPDGTAVNPYQSLMLSQGRRVDDRCGFDTNPRRLPANDAGSGYWQLAADGGVFSFGAAAFHGSMGGKPLNQPLMGLIPTGSGDGYWQLASDGGIFSFGDARFHGSTGNLRLNQPIVGMAPTPTGGGYWLVASDGGIFSFGDARFHGSTGAIRLNKPVVGMAPTPTGLGYWLVASDGGIFAFGDAAFLGSAGAAALPAPVHRIVPTRGGRGYWMLSRDGVVRTYGDAVDHGGFDRVGFCQPPEAVSLVPTATGEGYWIQAVDGRVFPFGDARSFGDVHTSAIPAGRMVDFAVAR